MTDIKATIPTISLLKNFRKSIQSDYNSAYYLKSVLEQNGKIVNMKLPFGEALLTNDPGFVRHVLQKNNKNYKKTPIVTDLLKKQIGSGLLTSEDELWLKQRRAIQPGFHRGTLEGISLKMIEEIKETMNTSFDKYVQSGETIDISKEMVVLAFRIVSKALFGQDVPEEELEAIDEVVTKSQEYVIKQVRRPYLKPYYYIRGDVKESKVMREKGVEVINNIINRRKQEGGRHNDLLDMLLHTTYEDGSTMSNDQLIDEILVLYIAGHETSAVALSWAFYLLSSNPIIENKLIESLETGLGNSEPSFEKLKDMGYTLQVVEEAMRLYPPAWLIDRKAIEEDTYDTLSIKKNTSILCFMYGVHRNEKYWKEADKFDPDRFTPENKKNHEPYSYLPFGGGPRLCIGNNFALMEMQFIIAMFFKKYTFELIPNQSFEVNPLLTLRPKNGILTKVNLRQ